MHDFKNKKIAIVGFGTEGVSSAAYLFKKGAMVTIHDKKNRKEFDKNVINQLEKGGVEFVLGDDYLKNLDKYDLIVRSPGIKLSLIEEAIKDATKKPTITSQTKLFFDLCPCEIIGVTGTKGKGTTTSLIAEMLKKAGKNVFVGGNIGKPPFDFLDTLNAQSVVVLELSSFQLMDLTKSPHIAVLLMITSEHLDYHTDVMEYVDAKRNLVRFQTEKDFAIVNRDYPASHESDVHTNAKVFEISRERDPREDGCYVKDEEIVIRQNGAETGIASVRDVLLPGRHNLENVCAAVMAATLSGVQKQDIVSVLKTFRGLEHRLELVRTVNGVRYYDDSFSTTPETAIAAIQAFKDPEILILGGSSKDSNFEELGNIIDRADNIKAIIGIGVEWPRIKEQITNKVSGVLLIEGAKTMNQVVLAAAKIAEPGDVVVLSPACASFDMFKNYKDRGEQFKQEVANLPVN
jgi:UDP-N-acetylmuramoylalanine--D-glutamate ligase